MKLYLVSVELEALVLAETPEDARRIADKARAIHDDADSISSMDFEVSVARTIPGSYDQDSLVYHELPDDITVAAAMKMTDSPAAAKEVTT